MESKQVLSKLNQARRALDALSEYEEEAAAGAALSSLFYAESADH